MAKTVTETSLEGWNQAAKARFQGVGALGACRVSLGSLGGRATTGDNPLEQRVLPIGREAQFK